VRSEDFLSFIHFKGMRHLYLTLSTEKLQFRFLNTTYLTFYFLLLL
jgi:hypothetical protein